MRHDPYYPEINVNDPDEYEEYISTTPLEARFDPDTIQAICVEAIHKHAAYGMQFDEYIKHRSQFSSYDDSDRKRLSFYLPIFPAMMSSDMATVFDISYHQFLVYMVELGLITFKYDYHEQYKIAKDDKKELSKMVTSERNRIYYLQMDKQTICIGSCSGTRTGKSKHFSPNVSEWLYNAITDTASYINMSITDFVYLCWCIGVHDSLTNDMSNRILDKDNDEILNYFDTEFNIYTERIKYTISQMHLEQ